MSQSRRFRAGWGVALLLAAPGLARSLASPVPIPAAPLVEEVVVEGTVQVDPRTLLALAPIPLDQPLDEEGLAAALTRIRRNPAIADVEVELRRGSERGSVVVVITVVEATRFFVGLDLGVTTWAGGIRANGLERQSTVLTDAAVAGYRLPFGASGLAFVALGANDRSFTIGVTENDLFGRGYSASLAASAGDCGELAQPDGSTGATTGLLADSDGGCLTELLPLDLDPDSSTWSTAGSQRRVRASLGIPLGEGRAVRLFASLRQVDEGLRRPAFEPNGERFDRVQDRTDWTGSVAYTASTLDDPELPSRGRAWQAGLEVRRLEANLTSFDIAVDALPSTATETVATRIGAFGALSVHRPLTPRDSLSLRGRALLGRSSIDDLPGPERERRRLDLAVADASIALGHSHLLESLAGERGELRWESEVEYRYQLARDGDRDFTASGFAVSSGLAYRTSWGVMRIRFVYRDEDPG